MKGEKASRSAAAGPGPVASAFPSRPTRSMLRSASPPSLFARARPVAGCELDQAEPRDLRRRAVAAPKTSRSGRPAATRTAPSRSATPARCTERHGLRQHESRNAVPNSLPKRRARLPVRRQRHGVLTTLPASPDEDRRPAHITIPPNLGYGARPPSDDGRTAAHGPHPGLLDAHVRRRCSSTPSPRGATGARRRRARAGR